MIYLFLIKADIYKFTFICMNLLWLFKRIAISRVDIIYFKDTIFNLYLNI